MIDAVIFDKDGTLFDFRSSWGGWVENLIAGLARQSDHAALLQRILGYDIAAQRWAADSPVVAMTTAQIAAIMSPHVPDLTLAQLTRRMDSLAQTAPMMPAVDLVAVLGALRSGGLTLGVATNDTHAAAVAHLTGAGVLGQFEFVAGCDSGWGGKPAPGQLLAFAAQTGIAPARCAMVGDSLHDLHAARAAGMAAVAVLTGVADAATLAPHADVVLTDIGGLAAWIAAQTGT